MIYFAFKAILSGLIIALVSEIAKRSPAAGALVVSLPLVSVLSMMWLWYDTKDTKLIAAQVGSTFWFFLPSMPMFLFIPWLLNRGIGFGVALFAGCLLTVALYLTMVVVGGRFGLRF
jgi:hypothetical protein